MKQEALFQSKLLKALRAHQALKAGEVIKLNADAMTKGLPDVMLVILGRTTFIELKCQPNEATKIQMYYLRKFAPHGYIAKKCRNGEYKLWLPDSTYCAIVYSIEALADEIVKRCVNA